MHETVARSRPQHSPAPISALLACDGSVNAIGAAPSEHLVQHMEAIMTAQELEGIIRAVGSLWPLCLSLTALAVACLFREQLRSFLDRATAFRVKKGDIEASAEAAGVSPETALVHSAQRALPEEPQTTKLADELSELEPTTRDEWRDKMWAASRAGDQQGVETAYQEMQEAEQDETQMLKNKATYLYIRYRNGYGAALNQLKELSERPEAAAVAHFAMGMCFEDAADFAEAAEQYARSADMRDEPEERALATLRSASCLYKAGKKEEAFSALGSEIAKQNDPGTLSALYEGLASLYQLGDDHELRAFALEKALQATPNDTTVRFGVAYSYAQEQFQPLSLFHYKTLLDFDADHAAALNNIGVAYEAMEMPIRAQRSYKQAVAHENTLASANLAYEYMRIGCHEEASKVLNQAMVKDNVHPNVGAALAAMSQQEEAEALRERAALESARGQRRFLLEFAEAYFVQDEACPLFEGEWRFPDGTPLTLSQQSGSLEASWMREGDKYRLVGPARYRGAKVSIQKMQYGIIDKDLEVGFKDHAQGYVYISRDGQGLAHMTWDGKEHIVEMLQRVTDDL